MSSSIRTVAAMASLLAFATGCTFVAPQYQAHVGNTLVLKEAGLDKVSIGDVAKSPPKAKVERISARGSGVKSPYGSYREYLREALKAEFDQAGLLDPNANLVIEGMLLQNSLSAAGLSRNHGDISAELTIKRDRALVWKGTKSCRHEWDSTLLGAIAIPRAVENYGILWRLLVAEFLKDPEFMAALKKR
jgi:hypothetical protein